VIKYALRCDQAHAFEGWFGSSADYDDQAQRGLIECPFCASHHVSKAIMAPAVAGTKKRSGSDLPAPAQSMMMDVMSKVRAHVEQNFDYVGDRFAREARDIHEGRSEERGIYGEAKPHEVKALVEDGIKVAPLPAAAAPKPKAALN
jgi:hypothetical protein